MGIFLTSWPQVLEAITGILENAFADVQFADQPLAVQVYPRLVISPTGPTIDMYPADPAREEESGGFGDISGGVNFVIRARVGTADTDGAQELLMAFMDDTDELNVIAPLFADPTLGGVAWSFGLQGPTGFSFYPAADGSGAFLGCQWTITVLIAHS